MSETTYKDAGVDIDAGNRAVELAKASVAKTHGPAVLAGVGTFGGLFSLAAFSDYKQPVLAASTDGVGTKVRIAAQYGRLEGVGHDLVNHCINDIMVQGAQPLFFLDYVASSQIVPEQIAAIVSGMAAACKAAGCALLGGETAEMPVYAGEVDVVGTIVGIVDREQVIDGASIAPGDVVLGLPSASPHTNGYSLIRHVLGDQDLSLFDDELDAVPLDLLLEPHRAYLGDYVRSSTARSRPRGLSISRVAALSRTRRGSCRMSLRSSLTGKLGGPVSIVGCRRRGTCQTAKCSVFLTWGLVCWSLYPRTGRDDSR